MITDDKIPKDKLKNFDFLWLNTSINIDPIAAITDTIMGKEYSLYR